VTLPGPGLRVPDQAAHREIVRAGRLYTPSQLLSPGWLLLEAGVVRGLGQGEPPSRVDRELGAAATIVPGLVDMHTHGGGGADMAGGDRAQVRAALAWSLTRGVTASVLSTVAAPVEDLERAIDVAAGIRAEQSAGWPTTDLGDHRPGSATDLGDHRPQPTTRLLGVHLEGPFLSPVRRGAHRLADLREPTAADVGRLLGTAPGTVLMVTIAPELAGAMAAVTAIRDAGAVAAVGHTDADADTTAAAVRAGARVATHLFNGMRGLHHREPGPPGALLAAAEVVCELINDGQHLHPTVVALAHRAAGDGRIALVTDAVAATGAPDGHYRIGAVRVVSRHGAVRVEDPAAAEGPGSPSEPLGGSLGGGAAGLDESLRRAILDVGLPFATALAAVTSTPAAALGVGDRVGSLSVGRPADLCVLDADLRVQAVCVGGRWLSDRRVEPSAARPV